MPCASNSRAADPCRADRAGSHPDALRRDGTRELPQDDIEGSPHRDTYRARLAAMESGGKFTFKLEPEAVAWKLVHAVESPRPRVRYSVTVPTYVAAIAKRLLPSAMADWIVRRV